MEAVLDTNLLISGVLWKGIPFQLLQWAESGQLTIFTSREILEEVHRVLHYPKFRKYTDNLGLSPNDLFTKIISLCTTIRVMHTVKGVCVDADDEKFLSCALSANIEVLVSGDKHLLDIGTYLSIRIWTAKQFHENNLHLCQSV